MNTTINKFLVALVTVLSAAGAMIADGITTNDGIAMLILFANALGVYAVANKPDTGASLYRNTSQRGALSTRYAVGIVTVISLLIGGTLGVSSAHASHDPLAIGHWRQFTWPGFTPNGVRAFYVIDRLGASDTNGHNAIVDVVNHFRYVNQANGMDGIVPAPLIIRQDEYAGNCDGATLSSAGGLAQSDPGTSYMLVCGVSGGSSKTWTGGGHFGENAHPVILLQRQFSSYIATWNSWYHEMLHGLGSEHVADCTDLLRDTNICPKLSATAQEYPSAHVINSLNIAYLNHPSYA